MKKIIYIYLLIISFDEIFSLKFGEEIPFDINNNEFELTFNEAGAILVEVTFNTPNILKLNMDFRTINGKFQVNPPGIGKLFVFKPNLVNKLILEYSSPSNEKGTIWMLPTTYEVGIKLNQTYEWKYNIINSFILSDVYHLSYSINKAEKDAILEFKYDNNMKIGNNIIAPNPSKICQGEICKNGITTYNIKKGESYKIYIAINVIKKPKGFGPTFNTYYIPSFSFHFIYEGKGEENETKNSIISYHKVNIILIITNILSLIILAVTCMLLWRKKDKSNIENNSNEGKKYELNEINDVNFEENE